MQVYRIENQDGNGPFFGDQKCLTALASHEDPEKMLDSAGINNKNFRKLCKLGWVFGWSSEALYDKFFTKYGKESLHKEGFMDRIYNPTQYVIFQDGQVMFKRDA